MPDANSRSPWTTLWLRHVKRSSIFCRPGLGILSCRLPSRLDRRLLRSAGQRRRRGPIGGLASCSALCCFSAVIGIVWLYLSALILSWDWQAVGRRRLHARIARGCRLDAVPSILGFFVLLLIRAAELNSESAAMRGGLALLVIGFGLWSFVVSC